MNRTHGPTDARTHGALRRLRLLALGLVLPIPLAAQALHIPYQTFTLPNGLTVFVTEDHSVPIVTVNTWYHVGSSDERAGRTGFAHLFEHLMFMGSQHVPTGDFDKLLEAAGGDNNGSTTEDRTNYYEDGPSNALELMLYLDSDRMGFLLPELTPAKVDLQRGVVQNERRQSYENQPYGLAEENILKRLYPPSHPYSWPVIGSMADLAAASIEDVRQFFRNYYTPNNATIAIGLEIAVVEKHEVPVVDVSLMIGAGSLRDPADLPGLATFTAAVLQEGAGNRNSLEIADEVGYLGARLFTGASYDAATASLHVPKRQIGPALDLLADVVLRPTFPDSEIARQRDLRRSQILQQRDQPVAMANIAFSAIIYGAAHPYGRPLNGTEASTAALNRDRIAQFYQAYYRPNNARILVVGDVTLPEAQALIAERFAGWAAGDVPAVEEQAAAAAAPRTIYLVDKPGAAQSVFRIGEVAVRRTTPDYFALTVLNTILGGSFTSRLNQNLRETHGYTYGANSQFAMRRMPGPFLAASSVVTAKTDSSLIEFMKELRRIRDETVPAAELTKAKAYITLGLPSEFETTAGAAAQFRDLLLYGLPLDYFATYIPQIDAVTAADVQRVARQYLDPDHFAIVVVGDRSQISSGLEALHEGPIVLRDLWGQAVP